MNKHTPGPWQVNRKYKMSVETCSDGQGINIIAECSDPDGIRTAGEDKANAQLIAAAPDLLEALEALHSCHRAFSSNDNWTSLDDDARAFAENAIAKARGES